MEVNALLPIEVQQKIVAKIEAERKMVDGCRELIALYEQKIKRLVEGVWGKIRDWGLGAGCLKAMQLV